MPDIPGLSKLPRKLREPIERVLGIEEEKPSLGESLATNAALTNASATARFGVPPAGKGQEWQVYDKELFLLDSAKVPRIVYRKSIVPTSGKWPSSRSELVTDRLSDPMANRVRRGRESLDLGVGSPTPARREEGPESRKARNLANSQLGGTGRTQTGRPSQPYNKPVRDKPAMPEISAPGINQGPKTENPAKGRSRRLWLDE